MKRSLVVSMILLVAAVLVLSACSSGQGSGTANRPAVPAAFANKTNPVAGNSDAVANGKIEYGNDCSSCHGASGGGDGPASSALTPKPSKLNQTVKEVSIGYLYWRISEGGGMEPFKSSMPTFKGILSEEKIWQVISYIQTWK